MARLLAAAMQGATVLTMAGDRREMADFTAELARQSGWDGISVVGPPLRIPAERTCDPVPG